jgi:hypothetical protein
MPGSGSVADLSGSDYALDPETRLDVPDPEDGGSKLF